MTTLVGAWTRARRRLAAAGIDSPAIDSRLLVEAAGSVTRLEIITDPHRALTAGQETALDGYLARREAREPLSHILGAKGFWKIMLRVTPDVLTPRPDSEAILDLILPIMDEDQPLTVVDLGTGSGAILLAILFERPLARGLGVDISEAAVAVARENAATLGIDDRVAWLRADWSGALAPETCDVVVANPPYVATAEIAGLEPEVRDHEPRLALDGGPNGLDAYEILAPEILRILRPGGIFAVEIGATQSAPVEDLFRAAGAREVRTAPDLARRDRVVAGVKARPGDQPPE